MVVATDSQECIRKAIAEKPDMIILDTLMTEKYDVMGSLRLEKGMENVLFLFTGTNSNQ